MRIKQRIDCFTILTVLAAMGAGATRIQAQAATDPLQSDSTHRQVEDTLRLSRSASGPDDLNLETLGSEDRHESPGTQPRAWLGVATEEATEALTSQLRLDPGVGLVVTYVATNSPASKAGLLQNDVLVAFNDQPLVHPQQLRKLVRVRKEGDAVKLSYYRAGKHETVSVSMAAAPKRGDWMENGGWFGRQGYRLTDEVPWDQYRRDVQERMKLLQRSLGDMRIDQKQIEEEVQRSADQAKRAAEAAMRDASNGFKSLGPSAKALGELARGWIGVGKGATITVNSSSDSVQTLARADDSGIYVLVASPRKHLTVHDPAGKLVFDGEIETPAQQEAVPKAVWEKARPLLDKLQAAKSRTPDAESSDP